jgi:hypothetical protein
MPEDVAMCLVVMTGPADPWRLSRSTAPRSLSVVREDERACGCPGRERRRSDQRKKRKKRRRCATRRQSARFFHADEVS